jgi:acylphosphatase
MSQDVEARRIVIAGRVQGVFYRASAERRARELGLSGWVRNLADGRVEAHAEGARTPLLEFVEWCRKGPPAARVVSLDAREAPVEGHASFSVLKK